jgi:hypothetical protein
VVEAILVEDPDQGGAERFQPLRLGVDAPAPGLDRIRSPAADCDVEVQPVLERFLLRHHLEPVPRALPAASTMQSRPRPSSSSFTPTARQ